MNSGNLLGTSVKKAAVALTLAGSVTAVYAAWPLVGWETYANVHSWRAAHEKGLHEGAMEQSAFVEWSIKNDCQRWKEQIGNLERSVIYAQERNSSEGERSAKSQKSDYEAAYRQQECAKLLMRRE